MESLIVKALEFFAIAALVLFSLGTGLYFSGFFFHKRILPAISRGRKNLE